ncbi:MAG: energy transducer TonB, partial [Candidatus Eremiobacteraeota bacterium]|nr:energy transducer TonB [Candidatus Eremiobacteraeota bacterium]
YYVGTFRELVLLFDDAGILSHAVYGERGVVSRLGLVATDAEMVKELKYLAPRIRNAPPNAVASGGKDAVIRFELGRNGSVEATSIAATAGDPAADAHALGLARLYHWNPARLNGRPVSSVAFRLVAGSRAEAAH